MSILCVALIASGLSLSPNLSMGDPGEKEPLSVAPVADAGSDQTVNVSEIVHFDGSGS